MSWDSPFLLLKAAKGAENGCLRASVLRRGTFGAKVPKTWGPFPWSPNPHRRPKGNLFASPVRTGRVGNDNIGILKGQNLPQIFLFSSKICEKNSLSQTEKGCFYYYIMFLYYVSC